jgi:hypothetical protein
LRTNADAEEWPESRDAGVATNRDVRASLITEAIVACDPVDALLAHGTQLGQVCTTGQWDRPALSASSAAGRAVKVRFSHRRRLLSGADGPKRYVSTTGSPPLPGLSRRSRCCSNPLP